MTSKNNQTLFTQEDLEQVFVAKTKQTIELLLKESPDLKSLDPQVTIMIAKSMVKDAMSEAIDKIAVSPFDIDIP